MANTVIFVILLNLGVNSNCAYVPLHNVMAQELAWQAQLLGPTSAGFFFFHGPSTLSTRIMTHNNFRIYLRTSRRCWIPAAPWCQTVPRRCRQHQPLLPGLPCWPGIRSSRPWSRWWRRGAWCRWPTAWCGHTSAQRHQSLSTHWNTPLPTSLPPLQLCVTYW